VDFSDIVTIKQSDLKRFEAEDLINPRPNIFAQVGSGSGGVTSGEGQPRQLKGAPRPVAQAGHFASLGVGGGDEAPDDDDSDDDGSNTTINPISLPPPDVAVGWGGVDASSKSR
jgi:hypothetical protein